MGQHFVCGLKLKLATFRVECFIVVFQQCIARWSGVSGHDGRDGRVHLQGRTLLDGPAGRVGPR